VLLRNWRDNCQKIQDNQAGRRRVGPTCGFTASPEVGPRATVDTLQTGYPYTQASSQDKERACTHMPPRALQHRFQPPSQGGLQGYHMSNGSRSRLPDRRTPTLPRVPWLWTLPPCRGGLWCTTCHIALDPTSLQGRALERRVSHSSGSCLPSGRAPMLSPHAMKSPVGHGPQAYRKA
jgi:hypothetical protein